MPRRLRAPEAIVYGTLVVGTLDALDAIVFFGLRSGVRPLRIFQGIASGLLGRASYQGGLKTAALGFLLHYLIAFGIVATYFLFSRRLSLLTRHSVFSGLLYPVALSVVMNFLLLPL